MYAIHSSDIACGREHQGKGVLRDSAITIARGSNYANVSAADVVEINICASTGSHEYDRAYGRADIEDTRRQERVLDQYHLGTAAQCSQVSFTWIAIVD